MRFFFINSPHFSRQSVETGMVDIIPSSKIVFAGGAVTIPLKNVSNIVIQV